MDESNHFILFSLTLKQNKGKTSLIIYNSAVTGYAVLLSAGYLLFVTREIMLILILRGKIIVNLHPKS